MKSNCLDICLLAICVAALCAAAPAGTLTAPWNQTAAARYLDSREIWWQSWPPSQRDHNTVCVSCHTVLPYALSRPLLHAALKEEEPALPERILLDNVRKRVTLWNEVEPYYLDARSGPGKSVQSRATEAVLNALILSSYDSQTGHLSAVTRAAFDAAWALQLKSGDQTGAWNWQIFHLAPWESDESQYQGATFMALAAGLAPERYRDEPKIQANRQLLRAYLQREASSQPLLNRVVLLWAAAKWPALLAPGQQHSILTAIFQKQHDDGGWSLSDLGAWKRRDAVPLETAADGYATGLVSLALHETGCSPATPQLKKGLAWLAANQNPNDGSWRAYSINKNRDLTTDVGRFMSDAATGYAVLALQANR